MYRQSKPYRKALPYIHHGKYFKTLTDLREKDEDSTFSLENMVVLDETDEDLSDNGAASPASCDDSESEPAAIPSSASDNRKDITIDDSDHPTSPESCDSYGSELASSSTVTVKTTDEQPKKKARLETPVYNETAPISPSSDVSNCSSSNTAPEAENVDEKSGEPTGIKDREKTRHRKQKGCQAIPHFKPVKSNKDVFDFLKDFEVTNESDVKFAIKMAKMFSRALNKYREEKMEEMVCTEAEHERSEEICTSPHTSHSSPSIRESLGISSSDQKQPEATTDSEFIRSCGNSSVNSSPTHSISHYSSSTDCKPCSAVIKQTSSSTHSPNIESNSSRSPTNAGEVIKSPNKTSATTDAPVPLGSIPKTAHSGVSGV